MKKSAVIGFYGESGTGKTSLITNVIKRLADKGLKIATIKKTRKKISMDTEGKDTWRHTQAGSKLVVLCSPIETDFILNEQKNIKEILLNINQLGEYDLILIEGANNPDIPKIKIGNISNRENTILNYNGDLEEVIRKIKSLISNEEVEI